MKTYSISIKTEGKNCSSKCPFLHNTFCWLLKVNLKADRVFVCMRHPMCIKIVDKQANK